MCCKFMDFFLLSIQIAPNRVCFSFGAIRGGAAIAPYRVAQNLSRGIPNTAELL